MKRRHFLLACASLPLLPAAQAAPATKPPAKAASKPAAKPAPLRSSKKLPSKKIAGKPVAASSHAASSAPNEPLPAQEHRIEWRTQTVICRLQLPETGGPTHLWLPLPLAQDNHWQRAHSQSWSGNFSESGIVRDPASGLDLLTAHWEGGTEKAPPQLTLNLELQLADRHFDIGRRSSYGERTEVLRRQLRGSSLISLNGAARRTAEEIVGRVRDPLAKGKVIYDWVIDHLLWEPEQVLSGPIDELLTQRHRETDDIGIALSFVALCRAAGLPARPVFGIKIGPSGLLPSLGAHPDPALRPHCRAEFYAPGYGWIPVDPADVLRATRSELASTQKDKIVVLRKVLFGFWEMNWMALNNALDIDPGGWKGPTLPYLAQPACELGGQYINNTARDQRIKLEYLLPDAASSPGPA